MNEQIAELEGRHRRNNLRFMGIKEKFGGESETWEKSKIKVNVFLQENLGLETDQITIERAHTPFLFCKNYINQTSASDS